MADDPKPDEESEEEVDPKEKETSVEDIVIDASVSDESEKKDPEKEPEVETVSLKDFEDVKDSVKTLEKELKRSQGDKTNLNKALHEARQKKVVTEDAPLSDDHLLKILDDNVGDSQTILNIVKYQAEQAAKKVSGEVVNDADMKKKAKEAGDILTSMYPDLSEDGSEMRTAVDETKGYYGLDDHPMGDFFATGIQVLNALPGLIASAEKRGEETALKGKADGKRKQEISDNLSHTRRDKQSSGTGLTESQNETAEQLGLSSAQMKTYKQIVGKSATVQVKE